MWLTQFSFSIISKNVTRYFYIDDKLVEFLGPRICFSGKRREAFISNTRNWLQMMIVSLRRPRLELLIFPTQVLNDLE